MKQPRNKVKARLSHLVTGKMDAGASFELEDPSKTKDVHNEGCSS